MNLIEQLGGYEEAKITLFKRKMHLKRGTYFGFQAERVKEIISKIESTLLEYRRQHNIYEVGDFIFHPMFGALFEIKRIAEKYVVASTKSGYETNLLIELISHATDEEIKAGKRLEVKSDS